MLMEIFIMGIGKMIKHMVLDNILMLMGLNMRGSGLMINSMAKVKKIGQMELNILVNINLAKKMGTANFFGLTILAIVEIF
jgi:hypothetical protein